MGMYWETEKNLFPSTFEKAEKMLDTFRKKSEKYYLAAVLFLCFCLEQYGVMGLFGFSIFPDEFGYWAPAAELLGWDWSQTSSLGSYYSFGYALILLPVLWLVRDSILAYRTAVFLNVVFMGAGLCLMLWLIKRLFPEVRGKRAVLISAIAVICPPWIFYMQCTMTEAMLLFTFLLVCALFYRFLENPGAVSACFLAGALVYLYTLHMRCVGTLAAAALTLLICLFQNRSGKQKRSIVLACIFLVLLFMVALLIKKGVIQQLYYMTSTETMNYNDYSGQWKKLFYVFSPDGGRAFLTGTVAKLLYLGVSTFGLAYWGMWGIGRNAFRLLKRLLKRDTEINGRDFFWLFLFLSVLAQILVTVFYTIGSADAGNRRLDLFVHGRYDELTVPILTAVGLECLLTSRRGWTGTGICAGLMSLFTLSSAWVVQRVMMTNVHGYFMVGMSYLLDDENLHPVSFLWKALCFGCVLMLVITAVAETIKKRKRLEWLLVIMVFIQVMLGMHASQHYLYIGNSYGYGDVIMADKVLEHLDRNDSDRVIHIYEGGTPYIEQVQFRLRDIRVKIMDARKEEINLRELKPEDKVIVQHMSGLEEELGKLYEKSWTSGHLSLFYNE